MYEADAGAPRVLTVLIATRNGAPTLARALAAHAALEAPPGGWKLVLIDNGSGDETVRIARSFADRLPLVLASEARSGKNRALNTGLRELAGDLAVFTDDDVLPCSDWLVRLRALADRQSSCAVFGGSILPEWEVPPHDWVLDWVRAAPVFALTDATWEEGPCEPTRVWGPNMAIRAEWFAKGYRFDERIGPDGSATYAMGGETELTLRLAIAERAACWHCRDARVHHIITARQMTRQWILKRAFRLGRCVRRESEQKARAGRPFVPRHAPAIRRALVREVVHFVSARRTADARREFEALWNLSLWAGCLYEALQRHLPSEHLRLDVVARA